VTLHVTTVHGESQNMKSERYCSKQDYKASVPRLAKTDIIKRHFIEGSSL